MAVDLLELPFSLLDEDEFQSLICNNINVPQRINYDDHIVHQLNATTEELRYELDPNDLISQHISSKYYTQNQFKLFSSENMNHGFS